jgi:hypothetical protein
MVLLNNLSFPTFSLSPEDIPWLWAAEVAGNPLTTFLIFGVSIYKPPIIINACVASHGE